MSECEHVWITDGQPEHEDFVLVAIGDEVWPAWWDQELWRFNDGPPAHPDRVTAWMEMPKIDKEGG